MTSPSTPSSTPTTVSLFLQCALQLLEPNTTPEVRRAADDWLGKFQLDMQAWDVAIEILKTVQDERLLFLAAQTLNRKIRFDRDQLGSGDGDVWVQLRALVVSLLITHSNRPVVCVQLSLGLVALTIQMETWLNAIPELMAALKEKPNVMLEVLRLIPEEVDDPALDVGVDRRYSFKMEMTDSALSVFKLLMEYSLLTTSQQLQQFSPRQLLDCVCSWISFTDIPGNLVADSKLLITALNIVKKSTAGVDFESAIDLLVETVHQYHSLDKNDLPVLEQIIPGIFELQTIYEQACLNQKTDVASGIARLFSHLGESYLSLILGPQELNQLTLVNLVLLVFAHDDFRIARKTYYFWLDFLGDLGRLEPPELRNQRIQQFQPILDNLVPICCKRMYRSEENMESDAESDVVENDDDNEDENNNNEDYDASPRLSEFETHRQEIGEILRLLLWASMDHSLIAPKIAEICVNSKTATEFEAGLIAFKSIGRDVASSPRQSSNGRAFETVFSLSLKRAGEDVVVRRATCDLICEVSEHISHNSENYLDVSMRFLIESLRADGGRSSRHASRAFKHLTQKPCKQALFRKLYDIFTATNPYDMNYAEGTRLDLLEGMMHIWLAGLIQIVQTGTDLDRKNLGELFKVIISPPLLSLSELVKQAPVPYTVPSPNYISAVDVNLRSLGLFVTTSPLPRFISPEVDVTPEAAEHILALILPQLDSFRRLPDRNMEELCQFLKDATRTFPDYIRQHAKSIFDFLLLRYAERPVPSLLYLCGVLFQQYFDCPELSPSFSTILTSLCNCTFDKVLTSPANFIENPDFVDDLFYFANRTIENLPNEIIQSPAFDRLIGMGSLIGVTLEHREAFRSVAVFLENAIVLGVATDRHPDNRYRPFLEATLGRHGKTLIHNLIQGAAGGLPAERVGDDRSNNGTISHVLFALYIFWGPQHFSNLVATALQAQSHLSNEVRGSFLRNFLKAAETCDLDGGIHDVTVCCLDFEWTAKRRRKRGGN